MRETDAIRINRLIDQRRDLRRIMAIIDRDKSVSVASGGRFIVSSNDIMLDGVQKGARSALDELEKALRAEGIKLDHSPIKLRD